MASRFWTWLHKKGSPPVFYDMADRWAPWLGWLSLIAIAVGLFGGLVLAPTDYQQGDSYRIIYIHVPSAWMSMFVYMFMASMAAVGIVWRLKIADAMALTAAPIGAMFTAVALTSGAIWGKPTWGTYWVWDARLTSELILLFLYLGYIALYNAIEDERTAARAAGILALVGVVNIPIIHFSVEWWHSLHQGPIEINLTEKSSLQPSMLWPLLTTMAGFQMLFFWALLRRTQTLVLTKEIAAKWVKRLMESKA
ncbi:MAG: heme ABC transporter permease [Gammaproteobacteria bacterium]|nr:heme ABC transporter permease [Gammaproteobacteria bacterium]